MVSAILVSQKDNARRQYIVRVQDWLNPEMYVINAQIPILVDTDVILKDDYKVIGWMDESGDVEIFKGGENT